MSTGKEDLIQPLIGVLNTNTNNNPSSSSSSSLPSRDIVSSYLRKKTVAHTLDTIVTELFTTQPDDPERHLLDFLLKRNPQVSASLQHHHQNNNNNNNNNNQESNNNNNGVKNTSFPRVVSPSHNTNNNNVAPILTRQDSGPILSPGDGTAPRQPIPPLVGAGGGTGGLMTRRRSVTGAVPNNCDRAGTPSAFATSSTSQQQVLGAAGVAIVPQTNLQAEELLQWILDVTDPAYVSHNNLHHTQLVDNNKNDSSTTSSPPAGASPLTANPQQSHSGANIATSTSNVKIATSNYTIRVPPGLESHPLASRCRQLATRYHATSAGFSDDDDENPADENDASAISMNSNSHFIHNSNTNNNNQQQQQQSKSSNSASSAPPPPVAGTTVRVTSPTKISTSFTRELSSGPTSPAIFSPAALNQLREAYNLSEENHGHLLLAVTDAMRIVLDWAGDALLVAENLARVVKLLVNGERCTVFVADERSQSLRTVIDGKPITVKFGQGIVGRCATQKKPLVVNNAYAHPSFNPSVDGEVNYITRNVLSMPMIVEGKLIAVVQVLNKQDSDFSEIDVEIFKAFTTVAGIVIRDAMTFPLTMRNLELAEGAKELCVRLMNVNMLSEKQAAQQWATMLRGYLGSDCCTILRVQCNESSEGPGRIHITPDQLDLTFVASDSAIDFGGFQPLPQKAIIAAALTNRAAELVNDARRDHRFDKQAARLVQSRASTSSLLVVPAFPFGDSDGSCNHYLGGGGGGPSSSSSSPPGCAFHSASTGANHHGHHHHHNRNCIRPLFCCYIVQFENFKETPTEIANAYNTKHNNNNNNNSKQNSPITSPNAPLPENELSGGTQELNSSTGHMSLNDDNSVSSANDIIFSDEAIEHISRIMPFFESVLRAMNLIHAQRHQSALLHETARAIGHLCDEKMDLNDAFDLLARTIEGMIQRETKRGSVLFFTKVDSEGIESMQLLPRASLGPAVKTGNNNSHHQQQQQQHNNTSSSTTGPVPPASSGNNNNNSNNNNNNERVQHQHRSGQTFRLRRRSSVSHLAFNNMFPNEVKVPIGFGIVGTAVAGIGPAYFTADEANELYSEGEFGRLVSPNEFPNCPVLVVPLADNRTLLGAMIILRPHGDIIERVMDILGFGFGNPAPSPSSATNTTNTGSHGNNMNGSNSGGMNGNKNPYGGVGATFMQSSFNSNPQNNISSNIAGVPFFTPFPPSSSGNANNNMNSNNGGNMNTMNNGNNNNNNRYGNNNYQIDRNFDWTTVTSDQLVQPARIDFLSILVSVAKYVLKASSTVNALARQQESLLFSGELERLAMPITNQSAVTKTGGGDAAGNSGNNNNNNTLGVNKTGSGTNLQLARDGNNSNNNNSSPEENNITTPVIVGGGAAGSNRLLSTTNFSQLLNFTNQQQNSNNSNNNNSNKNPSSLTENPLSPEMFDKLSSTQFPVFDFVDGHQPAVGLVVLTVHMFRSLNCLHELNIDEGLLMQAILKSFRRYRDVPYHNVFHAFDVTQSLFYFMKMAKLDEAFLPSERFAILLSAVFHDIDHNGLNNAYHAKAETAFGVIASLSGQKSVLEYHHCQVAIDVINSLQLLRLTSEEDRRRILRMFFQCILGTDMALHREIQQSIQSTFLGEDGVTRCFDRTNLEHRDLCAKMLLKMADISNPVKEFSLARRWALSVTEEFYRQGDVERLEGHTVQPMFDRHLNAELSKGQIGFITFMAQPFFNMAAKCFPVYEELTKNMDNNLSRWRKVEESNRVVSNKGE